MENNKKRWLTPELQIFGELSELTQQVPICGPGNGPLKGLGNGDTYTCNNGLQGSTINGSTIG